MAKKKKMNGHSIIVLLLMILIVTSCVSLNIPDKDQKFCPTRTDLQNCICIYEPPQPFQEFDLMR